MKRAACPGHDAQGGPDHDGEEDQEDHDRRRAKQPEVGQLSPPPAALAGACSGADGGTVAVPPLPQKTI